MSPAEKGTCSDSIQRYTYNVNMAKCLLFEYSGCEGNLNNFETVEECESVCDIMIQMSKQAAGKFYFRKISLNILPNLIDILYFNFFHSKIYPKLKKYFFLTKNTGAF